MSDTGRRERAAACFRQRARECVRETGVPPASGVEDEIVAHLMDAYEALLARGVESDAAVQRALGDFGHAQPIRRQFLLRGLRRDARRALRLPRICVLLLTIDASVPVVRWMAATRTETGIDAVWVVAQYLLPAIALLWLGVAGGRISVTLCARYARGHASAWELTTGLGILAASFGLLLATGPGAVFPGICDLIDRVLGRDATVAFTTLAVGLSVACASLWRDVARRFDQLRPE